MIVQSSFSFGLKNITRVGASHAASMRCQALLDPSHSPLPRSGVDLTQGWD